MPKFSNGKNLFAFIGNDEAGKLESLEKAVTKWLGEQSKEPLSREIYFGGEIKWEAIAESYESVSMFSSKKAIILKQFEKINLASQAKIADLLKNPNENTALFLLAEKLDGRSKIKRTFQEKGCIFECKLPYSNQIPGWLTARSKTKFKRQLPVKDAIFLWECLGDDLQELENELNKLNLYLPQGAPITAESIEKVIIPHRNINTYEMQKYMGLRNKARSLLSLSSVLDQGDPPFLIAIRMFNHFLKLLKIRTFLENGLAVEKIADILHIRQYLFKKELYREQAMARSPSLLKKILARLAQLEVEFKQGKLPQRFEIEIAFAELL